MFKSRFAPAVVVALALVSLGLPRTAANAALTIGTTSIASDSNLILNPASNIGIGNVNPQALLHLGTAGSRAGIIKLDGATSGTVTLQPASVAGAWTLTLPNSAGTNGQVLTTNGSGVTSWTTVAGGGLSCSGCTTDAIPKTTGAGTFGDSGITDDGTGLVVYQNGTHYFAFGADDHAQIFVYNDDSNHLNNIARLAAPGGLTQIGDLNTYNNTRIDIDDNARTIKAQTLGTFCGGDCDGNENGTSLTIDVPNGTVGASAISSINPAWQSNFTLYAGEEGGFNLTAHNPDSGNILLGIVYQPSDFSGVIIGDYQGAGNQTSLAVDDVNKEIKVQTTGAFCAGDCDGNENGTSLTIDDVGLGITIGGGSARLSVDKNNGEIQIVGNNGILISTSGIKPTCNAGSRGYWFTTLGAAGVADKTEQCMKRANDAYQWVTVVTAP